MSFRNVLFSRFQAHAGGSRLIIQFLAVSPWGIRFGEAMLRAEEMTYLRRYVILERRLTKQLNVYLFLFDALSTLMFLLCYSCYLALLKLLMCLVNYLVENKNLGFVQFSERCGILGKSRKKLVTI